MRSEREVERLVRENENLVHFRVSRCVTRYRAGQLEREDLVSWGLIGLVQAARAWDPQRSSCFSTLACKAIDHVILRGLSREGKARGPQTVSLEELRDDGTTLDCLPAFDNVEGQLLSAETRTAVRQAVRALRPRARRLIEMRFFEDAPVEVVAGELGVSPRTVQQQQKQALRELRHALAA